MSDTRRNIAYRRLARQREGVRAYRSVPLLVSSVPDPQGREGIQVDKTCSHLVLLKGDFLDPKQNQE